MKTTIEAYDHNLHTSIFTAEIDFEPEILLVNSVENSNPVWNEESVRNFLYNRAYEMAPKSYEDDLPALKRLGLTYNRHMFGRMSEAAVLLAILDNFSTPEDEIRVYPLKNDVVCMIAWASKYGNVYLWKKREGD